jgi:hypothetical protein
MRKVYLNESVSGLPKLINDSKNEVQLSRIDIASAYYGHLPNSRVECKNGGYDHSSKSIAYVIDEIIPLSDTELLINGNVFKKIENCSKFYVSEYGVVYSTCIKAFKRYNTSAQYNILNLVDDNGNSIYKYIHHLVYEAFIDKRTPKMTINHIDECKWNNHYTNLNELSYGENTHYSKQRISNSYDSIFKHKSLTWEPKVLEWMCDQMANHNKSASEICDILGATHERDRSRIISVLFCLREGKGNPFISKKYDFSNYNPSELRKKSLQKYDTPTYNAINYFINNEFSNSEISKILEIPRQTIYSYRLNYFLNNKEGSTTIEKVS